MNLSGANLSNTEMHDVTLLGANLSNADLRGAWLREINTSPEAEALCELEVPSEHFTTCRTGMNLTGANLSGARIESSNFRQADLSGVTASQASFDANLDQVDFSNAVLDDSRFAGSQYGTDWTAASARRTSGIVVEQWSIPSDLTDATVTVGSYAQWTNINLSGTTVNFLATGRQRFWNSGGGLVGVPRALPSGYKIVRGYIIGPDTILGAVDLSNTDLRGVEMVQVDLNGANLRGVNLSGATITAGNSSIFFGHGSSFDGADLTGANLQGVRINFGSFKSANLTNTNLSGSHSFLTDFSGSVMSGTQLLSASFEGVNFTGATGAPNGGNTSINVDQVTCPNGVIVPAPGTCWAT